MRDDQIRRRLLEVNPWWRAAATAENPTAWSDRDPLLSGRAAYDLGYRSPALDDVATRPIDDSLIVLRGPRRVGKSVVLKDTVVALCQRPDIDVGQIVYLPADGMRAGDLNRVAVVGRELTRWIDPAPRIWLLDEITSVAGWTETLKYLRDNTPFGTDTVVCTGSSWDPRAAVERDLFAGRAGRSSARRDRLLLPMRFRDVLQATGRDLPLPDPVPPWALQGPAAATAAERVELFLDEFDLAWQAFLTSGGFPRAVAEHHRHGRVGEAFLTDLAAWLHRDTDADAPPDSVPLLLTELARRSSAPLNRANCAETLGYPNRQTFQLRLDRLTRAFAALWCHQVDQRGTRIAGSQSKLYLTDPLLAWLGPQLRSGLNHPDMTQLSEAALAVALARAIDDLQPGRWTTDDAIGYLRTGKGNEIDLAPVAVPTASGEAVTTAIESKWVTHGWRAEARVIEGKLGQGLVATKAILDLQHPAWAIPAPIVSLLLS